MKALPLLALGIATACWAAQPAHAGLTGNQLATVGVAPPPGATAPLGLRFRDEAGRPSTLAGATGGRPAVLLFADYTCTTLCGAATTGLAALLESLGFQRGADYAALVVGLDPKDGPAEAAAAKARELASYLEVAGAVPFLSGDQGAVDELARAVGYRYAYDQEHGQYAHPAAILVLRADGGVSRVLASLGAEPRDLRLALAEAGRDGPGAFADRVRLLCYGFDPAQGIYTPAVLASLKVAALTSLGGLGGGLVLLRRRRQTAAR